MCIQTSQISVMNGQCEWPFTVHVFVLDAPFRGANKKKSFTNSWPAEDTEACLITLVLNVMDTNKPLQVLTLAL